MIKDTEFYNKASDSYSADRYPAVACSYTQFFFKKRLDVVIDSIQQCTKKNDKNLSVLEIGCADGILIRKVSEMFRNNFSVFLGVDISRKMIEAAVRKDSDTNILFKTREEYHDTEQFDLILEVGVINYASARDEIMYAHGALKNSGYYMCSVAGTDSLWNKIKPGNKGFSNFLPYREYEKIIQEFFSIEKKIPVGFFIPLVWRAPLIARIVQPIAEKILTPIAQNLFHEQVYILKNK
jgi:predicted TPR repeat methyltransferase